MFRSLSGRLGSVGAVLLGVVLAGCTESTATPSPSPFPSGPAKAVLAVGQRPGVPAPVGGAVWVPNTGDGTVTRIDPQTNRVTGTISIGNQLAFYHRDCEGKGSVHSFMVTSFHVRDCDLPSAVGASASALWVLKNDDQAVWRIDPSNQKVVARIALGFVPFDMDVSSDAVWIGGYWVDQLVRIDPATNAVVARLTMPDGVSGIASSSDAVWVASTIAGVVSRIDPSTNAVTQTVTLACPTSCFQGSMPLAVAVDANAVWVRTAGDGLVVRLDPRTGMVTSTIEVTYPLGRNGLDHIALLDGSLWVAGVSLQRIDEASNRIAGTIGVEATSVTSGFGSLWITDLLGHVERINPTASG